MSNVSLFKEAIIASVTAVVVIPLLWLLGAAMNPHQDAHSPGFDLIVLTLVGAGLVMLLRSTWRETDVRSADRDRMLDDWDWREFGDPYGGGNR